MGSDDRMPLPHCVLGHAGDQPCPSPSPREGVELKTDKYNLKLLAQGTIEVSVGSESDYGRRECSGRESAW